VNPSVPKFGFLDAPAGGETKQAAARLLGTEKTLRIILGFCGYPLQKRFRM
jgi:hypothetical protein